MKRFLFLAAFVCCFAPGAALADGVTDFVIDPAASYIITVPGSYRLAANVTMSVDAPAITVNAASVTIDLNGHSLFSVGVSSTTDGIFSSDGNSITVLNGRIFNFGGWGISLGDRTVVRDCQVSSNNRAGVKGGISGLANSIIESCIVRGNSPSVSGSTTGISVGAGSQVRHNTVEENDSLNSTSEGIFSLTGCLIEDNTVSGNGGNSTSACQGIDAVGSTVRGNLVRANANNGSGACVGIESNTCLVESNVCEFNMGAFSVGIRAGISTITGNRCASNSSRAESNGNGCGIEVASSCLVERNHLRSNNSIDGVGLGLGILATGSSNQILNNACVTHTSDFGLAYGIRVNASKNLVLGNSTSDSKTAGLIFLTGLASRAASNQFREATGIDLANGGLNPASLGAGDLANVVF